MATPLKDFGRVLRAILRFGRAVSYGFIILMVVFLAFRVAEVYRALAEVHDWLGWLFLLVFAAAVVYFIGRPVYRFFKVPIAVRPPNLPPAEERKPKHMVRHLDFLEKYINALGRNPEWTGAPDQIDAAVQRCHVLREQARSASGEADLKALGTDVAALENGPIADLLAPLDQKASDVIRGEALGIGIATAVSLNGTIDAFIVLWRSCNLVSRIATIYYGRPGARGSLRILRDVSVATLASAYMQDVSETVGGLVGGLLGKTAGVFAGPVLDGSVNAIAALRIGYLAKARCRSFSAWTERTRAQAVRGALSEAAAFSKGVVKDLVKTVGSGLLALPGKVFGKMSGAIASWFIPKTDGDEPAPESAPSS